MPIFEQYMRGQKLGAQQGLNALQRAKMIQEQQRQQQLRNVLSQAVTPAVPGQTAMPAAPAMGPIQPGAAPLPEYPEQAAVQAQPARFDLQRAIPMLAKEGLGPEAIELQQQMMRSGGGIGTYNPRDYTSESWAQFVRTRDPSVLERYATLEERIAQDPRLAQLIARSQADITGAKAEAGEKGKAGVKLVMEPKIRAAIKDAEVKAKGMGEAQIDYARAKAAMPGLIEVADKLGNLAGIATYTYGGRAWDTAVKELGFGSTEGATARSTMTSIVDNQVLPLLRDTFGAAFTQKEGESLRATLLDINATPEQKKATLKAFIEQKYRNLETKQKEIEILGGGPRGNQDKQALEWARKNPNDPRALKILQLQGKR